METKVIANLRGAVVEAQFEGRDYLVATVTLMKAGIMNGSKGPIMYEPEDIHETTDLWNDIPLTFDHTPGSARTRQELERSSIGRIYNARFIGDRLKAEAWFDIEKCNKVDHRILQRVRDREKIEVSTGLKVALEKTEGVDDSYNPYVAIARNYRPDHLAVLLSQKGACSVLDGCGINNEETEMSHHKICNCDLCRTNDLPEPLGLPVWNFESGDQEPQLEWQPPVPGWAEHHNPGKPVQVGNIKGDDELPEPLGLPVWNFDE